MSTVIGIDLAGCGVCTATCDEHRDVVSAITQRSPAEMVLPLHAREPLLTLAASALHRRGSGLLWPPEAQVPVLGDPRNGRGRRYLAELLDRMASDGALSDVTATYDTTVSWRPDGQTTVDVPAEKLVAAAALGLTQARAGRSSRHAMIGMVVPEELPLHGQQQILDALGGAESVMLVPAAVAAAAAWCFEGDGKDNRQQITADKRLYAGYIDVVDLGLGRWGVARFAIYCVRKGPRTYLVPLRAKENRHYPDAKSTGLSWLSGQAPAGRGELGFDGVFPGPGLSERLEGKCMVELGAAGRALRDALKQLRAATDNFVAPEKKGWGESLGTLLIGGLDQVGTDAGGLLKLVQDFFPDASPQPLEAASRAAAWIAGGRLHDWPTWLERLEPLDFYCHAINDEGDMEEKWISLEAAGAIDAATEFIQNDFLPGLYLRANSDRLAQYLRVDSAGRPVIKEGVFLLNRKDRQTDVTLNLRARPGQGHAMIELKERETGVLLAALDWSRMVIVDKAPGVTFGYVPNVVQHEFHDYFRARVVIPLEEFLETAASYRQHIRLLPYISALRTALAANVPAGRMPPGSIEMAKSSDPFLVYSLIPQIVTRVPDKDLRRDLETAISLAEQVADERASSHGVDDEVCEKMDRLLGWTYWSCPRSVIKRRLNALFDGDEVRQVELDVLGLGLRKDDEIGKVVALAMKVIAVGQANNNWYRCLRNLFRYNQHALRSVSDSELEHGMDGLIRVTRSAVDDGKTQILRNCLEMIVYLLKRRRYSAGFLEVDGNTCGRVRSALHYAKRNGRLNPAMSETVERALRFIDKTATGEDIINQAGSVQSE